MKKQEELNVREIIGDSVKYNNIKDIEISKKELKEMQVLFTNDNITVHYDKTKTVVFVKELNKNYLVE